jgi:hypothetical protein
MTVQAPVGALAQAILAEHGLSGRLQQITPNLWQLRGEIGNQGAAAEFDGEPDEALIREATRQLRQALA